MLVLVTYSLQNGPTFCAVRSGCPFPTLDDSLFGFLPHCSSLFHVASFDSV